MKRGDLVSLADIPPERTRRLVDRGLAFKQSGHRSNVLDGRVVALLFAKPSLRTRVSFEMAARHLGGEAIYLGPQEVGLGKREAISDVARVLSRYVDLIVARTFSQHDVEELARWSTVPVVNGLSDRFHPCQALADLITIKEHFGYLAGVNLAYVGDGNNVAHSLLIAAATVGISISVASPSGYTCDPAVVSIAQSRARESHAEISLTEDPHEAVAHAQVVYTDTWTSMGQESEVSERRRVFRPYRVDQELLSHAQSDAIVMHCLPAHRGEEITDDVIDGPQSAVFDQAENRMHAQKAVLAWLIGRSEDDGR